MNNSQDDPCRDFKRACEYQASPGTEIVPISIILISILNKLNEIEKTLKGIVK